ncbi:MAG: hypothetical protein COZ49_04260 [Candidatus Yonathbacteria bacterium CG_4_10_14_3_um_filter_47_65]|uniref:Uncharacterized protein n=2 Tax=Parcubacteria group TaxID=1794811 RepID=A0A2M8D921_9BACT|nr:MAG: hypothetical protein AUJ44_00610 [Candidatus Nomurabacteria bacterium CG1_02_47_685]PIP03934.1 MAG: hypothetical protein COX54_01855 [Candidatus Yonathbacteria bacterium CG23_combo_of_CG06-09_8_20_14_all_46_18]PIQ32490.1 MAG: hypothetical protein COW61_01605 [Candidatus Yonathbacteria bacterium CG17_big_fil_post_rev_8_21_14_2_50_46_19]PIX56036.1 MAG: hypothetical protein COZ49_04260 [Candidatus Yonathbacteria bacterium CG_4_10_14_3_um_filter_47_65]PIY57293.1 MAG: hypothetical protein CO
MDDKKKIKFERRTGYGAAAVFFGVACALFPLLAFADPPATFKDLVKLFISSILDPLVPLIIGLALVYFLWGVSKYILHGDDEKKREEGRQMMVYGIIGLFVMVSVWGLVNILVGTFGLSNIIPQLPT